VLNNLRFLNINRIRKNAEFVAIRQSGSRLRNRHLIINYKEKSNGYSRLGVVLAKRHVPKAVRRNQLKRQIKEWFRHHKNQLQPMDYVIIVTRSAGNLSHIELKQCLESLLQKVNSRCKSS